MSDRPPAPADERAGVDAVRSFYGRWVRLYDAVARYTPGIPAVRRRAVDACRLAPGDTAVEMGTGTGANLPYLRAAVGPGGRVLGVDVTRPGLVRARRRLGADDPAVGLAQADATRPPLRGPVDAVLASFVSGMVRDPAAVVESWCDLAAGGHVVLVDAAPSRRTAATPLNAAFRLFTALSTPPTLRLRYEEDLAAELDDRVGAAHRTLRERAEATATAETHLGFVRLTGGRIPEA